MPREHATDRREILSQVPFDAARLISGKEKSCQELTDSMRIWYALANAILNAHKTSIIIPRTESAL